MRGSPVQDPAEPVASVNVSDSTASRKPGRKTRLVLLIAVTLCLLIVGLLLWPRTNPGGGTADSRTHEHAATPSTVTSAAPDQGTGQEPGRPAEPEPVGLNDAEVAEFVTELPAVSPGVTTQASVTMPDGQERRYLYSTPPDVDPEEPLPVLLALGGWNDPPENFLDYADFDVSAAGSEAVVVYPAGVAGAWAGAPYSETSEAADISFLRAVVSQLDTAVPVDRERIYSVGMSNGGGMALELACHAPDFVAGVSVVSGAFYEGIDEDCMGAAVPTQIIHGTDDELLDYEGGTLHETPYLGVADTFRTVAERNGCSPEATDTTPLGDNSDQLTMTDCAADTEHIRVNGGFHDWYQDPDTPAETWRFLSAQKQSQH